MSKSSVAEAKQIRVLRSAGMPVWRAQLVALTERLLEGPGDEDAAEVVRALAWAVTSGNRRMLGKLSSLAVRELLDERARLAHVPPEDRYLAMEHPDLGPVLVSPAPVHTAHATTDEVNIVVQELVTHPYKGLSAVDRSYLELAADDLAMLVLSKLATQAPRLRALVPTERLIGRRVAAARAAREVLERTDPAEAPTQTARAILSAVLRASGADPRKVKDAIQATTRGARRSGRKRGGQNK